jgi:hypothetical protein
MLKSIYNLKAVACRDKNDQLVEYAAGDDEVDKILLYGYKHVDVVFDNGTRIFYPYHQIIRGDYYEST